MNNHPQLPVEITNRFTAYFNNIISTPDHSSQDPSTIINSSSLLLARIIDLVVLFNTLYTQIYDCTPIYLTFHDGITRILNQLNMSIHIRLRSLSHLT